METWSTLTNRSGDSSLKRSVDDRGTIALHNGHDVAQTTDCTGQIITTGVPTKGVGGERIAPRLVSRVIMSAVGDESRLMDSGGHCLRGVNSMPC